MNIKLNPTVVQLCMKEYASSCNQGVETCARLLEECIAPEIKNIVDRSIKEYFGSIALFNQIAISVILVICVITALYMYHKMNLLLIKENAALVKVLQKKQKID